MDCVIVCDSDPFITITRISEAKCSLDSCGFRVFLFVCQGIFLVYDITSSVSFQHIMKWITDVDEVRRLFPFNLSKCTDSALHCNGELSYSNRMTVSFVRSLVCTTHSAENSHWKQTWWGASKTSDYRAGEQGTILFSKPNDLEQDFDLWPVFSALYSRNNIHCGTAPGSILDQSWT